MHKLIDSIVGSGKHQNTAKKYALYAAMGTLAALVLAVVILVVSSIMFAAGDKTDGQVADGDGDVIGGGNSGGALTSSLTYTEISSDELDAKAKKQVKFKSEKERTITSGTNDLYYAKYSIDELSEETMEAAHQMFVAFYNANKASLITDIGSNKDNKDCTIPLLKDKSKSGTSFKIFVFGNDKSIYNNDTYKWLYSNAYKYGFITSENTFTYVGVAAASYMHTNKLTTVDMLVSKLEANGGKPMSVSATVIGGAKPTAHQMYYMSADAELKVPSNYAYSVLSHGENGYIITVDMSAKISTT